MGKDSLRIHSIDFLRGLVMMIMALDHVRDFFHADAMKFDPLDLSKTNGILFFTRWITNFCAPVFVFLAGTSAYLSGIKKDRTELSVFLLKRGAWLIVMEVAIVNLGWSFNIFYNTTVFQVIWAIGISMIILGLCIRLPFWFILVLGSVIVLGHNLLDPLERAPDFQPGFLWDLLHRGGFSYHEYLPGYGVLIIYPFVPWTGLMIMGFCFGKLLEPSTDIEKRKRRTLLLGTALLLAFFLLRYLNTYGDPHPWSVQENPFHTILSFINVNKYPPSLLFMCIMIGPALIVMGLFKNPQSRIISIVKTYGRVPFFYYVLHIYLIHILVVVTFFASGYTAENIVPKDSPFFFRPRDFGYGLGIVYLLWAIVLILLYPLCKWYDNYKTSHKSWWLKYI